MFGLSLGAQSPGFGGFMIFAVIIRILLVAAAAIAFVIRRRKGLNGCKNSALIVLGEKYARGEITEEEYLNRRSVLTQK